MTRTEQGNLCEQHHSWLHAEHEAKVELEGEQDNLKAHADSAAVDYLKKQPFHADLAEVVGRIIKQSLERRAIKIHSVQSRAKDVASFSAKAATPSEENPRTPKYANPLSEITDLSGVRVITHFLITLSHVDDMLRTEFQIAEKSNKGMLLIEADRFGYQSIHYLLKLKADRAQLPEYQRFAGSVVEVQVRTILQHAWAEIEHDIQYKSSLTIPAEIRRRFVALAGMLELADREFQSIDDANSELETVAESSVEAGELSGIEITPKALKLFLDRRLGPDGRMSAWNYDWTARLLKTLGFRDLRQVEDAISPYDDHNLSIILEGARQGQLTRFEMMLQAALGEDWNAKHPWRGEYWQNRRRAQLDKLHNNGVTTGTFKIEQSMLSNEKE